MAKKIPAVQQDQLSRIIQDAVSTFANSICQVAIQMRVEEHNRVRAPVAQKQKKGARKLSSLSQEDMEKHEEKLATLLCEEDAKQSRRSRSKLSTRRKA